MQIVQILNEFSYIFCLFPQVLYNLSKPSLLLTFNADSNYVKFNDHAKTSWFLIHTKWSEFG